MKKALPVFRKKNVIIFITRGKYVKIFSCSIKYWHVFNRIPVDK